MDVINWFFENNSIFISILNKSFIASYVIIIVILIRLLLKKSPKIFSYLLWSVVAFRLAIPFSINSVLSLLPKRINTTPIPIDVAMQTTPQINGGFVVIEKTSIATVAPSLDFVSVSPLQVYATLGMIIWVVGIIGLLSYSIISIVKLKKQLSKAYLVEGNIYEVSNLKTPFVFGVLKPIIYLPNSLTDDERKYIIKHEQVHIKRKDYVVKVFAFVLLTIYWFNPLVWVAFILMNKDMEYSCDESVLKELQLDADISIKKSYATSLVTLATEKKVFNGSPLAFGEGNVKGRVKNVLQYKKPKFWIVLISVIVLIVVLIGLFLNPKNNEEAVSLTSEEIQQFNKTLEDSNSQILAYMSGGDNYIEEPLAFFLTSYYEKPEEMDMGKFTYYIPRISYLSNADQTEYDCLNEFNVPNWKVEDLVTPFGRIPYTTVEKYLNDYMNLSIDDMTNMGNAVYSDTYKTFYSGTSDVWTSDFVCTYGTKKGNIITLGNEFETLTVKKEGRKYYIISFLPVEFSTSVEMNAVTNADKTIEEIAKQWANAYQYKDAKDRYALMTPEFQETYYNELVEKNGEENTWYLRGSSPWVESYEIVQNGNNVVITYIMEDSIPQQYIYQEELFLREQDGKILVHYYRVNVDNLPIYLYEQGSEIQKSVDEGNDTWLLTPESVVLQFVSKDLGYDVDKFTSESYYEYSFETEKDEKIIVTLYRPMRQDDTGFLAVKGYEIINKDTNKRDYVNMTDSLFPIVKNDMVEYEGELGILIGDVEVNTPYIITVAENQRKNVRIDLDKKVNLNKNDLVLVYDESAEYYKVVIPYGEYPYIHGEVKKSLVSFDSTLFASANQGYLDNKVYYDKINGKPMAEGMIGTIVINQRKDGWISFYEIDVTKELWVKEEDVTYNIPTIVYDLIIK